MKSPGPKRDSVADEVSQLQALHVNGQASVIAVFEGNFDQSLDARAELRREVQVEQPAVEATQLGRVVAT